MRFRRYGVVVAGAVVVPSAGGGVVAPASAASPASSFGPWPMSVVPVVDCSYAVSAASPASSFGPWLQATTPNRLTAAAAPSNDFNINVSPEVSQLLGGVSRRGSQRSVKSTVPQKELRR